VYMAEVNHLLLRIPWTATMRQGESKEGCGNHCALAMGGSGVGSAQEEERGSWFGSRSPRKPACRQSSSEGFRRILGPF
jgi:hypothetical protein